MESFESITKRLVVILLGLASMFLFNYSFNFLLFSSIPLFYDHLNSLQHYAVLGNDRTESIYFELPKVLSTFFILGLFIVLISICLLWIFLRKEIKFLIIELSVVTTIILVSYFLNFFNFNSLFFFDLISLSEVNNNLTYYLLVNGILLMIASIGTFILLLKFLKRVAKKRLSKL